MAKLNVEKLFRGRSHRKGERASNARESGARQYGVATIREHRDRSSQRADKRMEVSIG